MDLRWRLFAHATPRKLLQLEKQQQHELSTTLIIDQTLLKRDQTLLKRDDNWFERPRIRLYCPGFSERG